MLYRNKIPKVVDAEYYSAHMDRSPQQQHDNTKRIFMNKLPPLKSREHEYYRTKNIIDDFYGKGRSNSIRDYDEGIYEKRSGLDYQPKYIKNNVVDLRRYHDRGVGGMSRRAITQMDSDYDDYGESKMHAVSSLNNYETMEIRKNKERGKPIASSLSKYKMQHQRTKPKKQTLPIFKTSPQYNHNSIKINRKPHQLSNNQIWYEQMMINGKMYLVKRIKKRPQIDLPAQQSDDGSDQHNDNDNGHSSELSEEVAIEEESEQQEQYAPVTRMELSRYELTDRDRYNKDKEKKRRKEQKLIQLKKRREKERKELLLKGKTNDELSQQSRRYIHLETYYQLMERKNKLENLNVPQRMKLNTMNKDGERELLETNAFYKNNAHFRMRLQEAKHHKKQNEEDKSDSDEEMYNIKFPKISEIMQAINTYKPLTKLIDTYLLTKHPSFIKQYNDEPGKEFFYFGEFDNKKVQRSGRGVLVTKQNIKEGIWRDNQLVEGAELRDQGLYRGEFLNGVRHGEGTYEWINGQSYSGTWKHGKRHGKGHWKSKKGEVYIGDWLMGKATGYGELEGEDNEVYKGNFLNFVKHGRGNHQLPNGDLFIGQFLEGVPNGKGKYLWKNGAFYQGQFKEAIRDGKGLLKKEDLFSIEGDFKNDLPHGICRLKLANGYQYKGKFNYGDHSTLIPYDKQNPEKSSNQFLDLSFLRSMIEKKSSSKTHIY